MASLENLLETGPYVVCFADSIPSKVRQKRSSVARFVLEGCPAVRRRMSECRNKGIPGGVVDTPSLRPESQAIPIPDAAVDRNPLH